MSAHLANIFVITAFGTEHSDDEHEREIYAHRQLIKTKILDPIINRFFAENGYNIRFDIGSDNPNDKLLYAKIMQDIYDADMVLAVIFEHRPNVYLEIGWSQAFWNKTMFLKRSDVSLPADILGHEVEEYKENCFLPGNETALVSVQDGLYRRILANLKRQRRLPPHFLEGKSAAASGSVTLYNRFSKGVTPEDWANTIDSAKDFIIMCIPKLYRIDDQAFSIKNEFGDDFLLGPLLLRSAIRGVRVTILMSHPDSYSSWHFPSKYRERDLAVERNKLRDVYNKWNNKFIANYLAMIGKKEYAHLKPDGFRVIAVQDRYLPFRVTLTEQRAITTIRFYSEPLNSMHCIDAPAPTDLNDEQGYNRSFYSMILHEMNFLIRENETR
jgi:hypothetical protein